MAAAKNYQTLMPLETITKLELVEIEVRLKRTLGNEEAMDDEFI
jgi:hypothetical protein